ncbi:MAG: hypothetical protein LBM93_07835 [Oscillospiraceae bacterium]|jgi:hypothetical protein|nr:hypothetical protein [Oscillospiraceae bacterium]
MRQVLPKKAKVKKLYPLNLKNEIEGERKNGAELSEKANENNRYFSAAV